MGKSRSLLNLLRVFMKKYLTTQRDKVPTPARRCAQIKNRLRLAECVHPEKSLIIRLLRSDGYIEYCSDCDKVTDLYDP